MNLLRSASLWENKKCNLREFSRRLRVFLATATLIDGRSVKLVGSAAGAGASSSGSGGHSEFGNRERHLAENTAGVVFAGLEAFLVGNGIFGCVYYELRGSDKSYYREYAERNGKNSLTRRLTKLRREARGNGCGNIRIAASAEAYARFFIGHLYTENNGVNDLGNSNGTVTLTASGLGKGAEARITGGASEYADGALSAVKYNVFVNNSHSVEFLRSAFSDTSLKNESYIVANGNRIEASVELNGVNSDRCPYNFCIAGADGSCARDNIVTEPRQIDADVFEAIAVAAGIENTVRLDADGVFRS